MVWRVMGEVGGCWQCSPGLCNPLLSPSIHPFLPPSPAAQRSQQEPLQPGERVLPASGGSSKGGAQRGRKTQHWPLSARITWSMWKEASDEELTPIILFSPSIMSDSVKWQEDDVFKIQQINLFLFATNVVEIATGVPDRTWLSCSEIALALMWLPVFSLLIALRVDSF